MGVSILPYLMIKDDLKEKDVVRVKIDDVNLVRNFMVIYNQNKYLTETAQAFIELCKDWTNVKDL